MYAKAFVGMYNVLTTMKTERTMFVYQNKWSKARPFQYVVK